MKKVFLVVFALIMLVSCVACGNESNNESNNSSEISENTSQNSIPETDDTSSLAESSDFDIESAVSSEEEVSKEEVSKEEVSKEEVVYEVNLPDDVILKIADKEVSVEGRLAHEIFDTLDVEYKEQILNSNYEVPPSTLYYKPNHPNAVISCVTLTEMLESDYKTLFLHRINVNFSFADRPDVEFLGVTGGMTEADIFKIFGKPDSDIEDKRNRVVDYYWYDVQIGDICYKSLTMKFIRDELSEVTLYPRGV